MKKLLTVLCCLIILNACKKTKEELPSKPSLSMTYINLFDTAVLFQRYLSLDLDGNGEKDVIFSTLFVGNPISKQDKKQWLVTSSFNSSLPVNDVERIPVLNLSDSIFINNFQDYSWYNASLVMLAQKIIGEETSFWEGDWKSASHQFVPLQIKRNGALYSGWIEVSFSMADEKIILHKAAICKEENKSIRAGK